MTQSHQKLISFFGSRYIYVESTNKPSKIGHLSVEVRGCFKKSSDRKYLIEHHPFDKAKYEIKLYIQVLRQLYTTNNCEQIVHDSTTCIKQITVTYSTCNKTVIYNNYCKHIHIIIVQV